MMHSSGRDSGYCENASPEFCETVGPISSDVSPFLRSPTGVATPCRSSAALVAGSSDAKEKYKCGIDGGDDEVHLILSPDCRITGSSCRALKHAVSNLTRLDDFVCEKIGDGFFSEVFKVTHRVTGQVMVLKMNLLRSNRANMLKEVQLMNQLSHPNILKFIGVCVHEGQLHALTEYINGGSLEQLIQSPQELTYSVRMKLALDIAKGMQYLHSQDVFHRDLTSKNVLIKKSEDGQEMTAVVGDFGLAAKIPRPGVRLPTVGSPWWMSPECLKGQCYDQRSDVFSYGIVLCELIARVDADPDVLPRTSNFGLDYLAFVGICSQLPQTPPPEFLKLAFSCCNLEPKNRPSFADVVKILENIVKPGNNNHYLLNGCTLTEAKSEEVLPCPSPSPSTLPESKNSHRKLIHRRSSSDDTGLIVFPAITAPSDKARCHLLPQQNSVFRPPLLMRVGESMYQEDPHYVPSDGKSNPFASLSKFKGVKKVLAQTNSTDLFSSCFELPSPFHDSDECKPSFYSDLTVTKMATELPNTIDVSFSNCSPIESRPSHRSSILIEPVVKPSEIRKSSSTVFKSQTSSDDAFTVTKFGRKIKSSVTAAASVESSEPKKQMNTSSLSSSSSSSSSCNTSSATLRLKDETKTETERLTAGRREKCKPSSLPSSPTFLRRRASFPSSFSLCKNDEIQNSTPDCLANNTTSKKVCSSLYLDPIYKSRGCLTDTLLSDTANYGSLLRSYSSSSNISALDECSNVFFLPAAETPTLNLRRRGSCESGFYSSVGEDCCVPGIDVCVGHHHYTASSVTLSSSSAASSLFLDSNSEDNSTPVFFSGRYPCSLHNHHYHHHHHNHNHHHTSSVYTDSSEDVSSLASSETPVWDDKQKPQHISKIVEYFERKQGGNSNVGHKLDFLESSNRLSNFHTTVRRKWVQSDNQPLSRSSLDYYTRRKLFEKPFTGGSHVLSKRSTNQRLLVCEGAVKSKLPIFDKNNFYISFIYFLC